MVMWRLRGHRHEAHGFALSHYLGRSVARFGRVMARLASGQGFRVRASRAGAVRPARGVPRLRLPMARGWVAGLGVDVRMTAAIIGFHLNRTEVAPMIAACPQAQRVLRPMCWLLGIDAPCVARVVRRRRGGSQAGAPPSPHPRSASQPEPANAGEGEVSSPRPRSALQPKPANAGEGEEAAGVRAEAGALPSPHSWSASQPKPARAGEGEGFAPSSKASPPRRLTRAERKDALWYSNSEGRPYTWQFLKRGNR